MNNRSAWLTSGLVILVLIGACNPVQFKTDKLRACSSHQDTNCSGVVPGGSGGNVGGGPVPSPTPNPVKKTLALGLLTSNLACVMCHTRINGDVSGFGTVTMRHDSVGEIFGNIYAADLKTQKWTAPFGQPQLDPSYVDTVSDPALVASVLPTLVDENITTLANGQKIIKKGEKHNFLETVSFPAGGDFYTLTHHVASKRATAQAHLVVNPFTNSPIVSPSDFPALNVNSCISKATGKITLANGNVLSSPINGNRIFINGQRIKDASPTSPANSFNNYDPSCPSGNTLTLQGEVVVQGDLVLAGCIKGQGTIYATGSIYIPDDIKVQNSAFPYPQSLDDNAQKVAVQSRIGKDMISLGAQNFIVIGPLSASALNVLTNVEMGPDYKNNLGALTNIFNWLSTGTAAENKALYESSFLKRRWNGYVFYSGPPPNGPVRIESKPGAVALVEANLYANIGIAAVLNHAASTNLVVNGSVITPDFGMLATGFNFEHRTPGDINILVNPFNNTPFARSEINQDFRLKHSDLGYECHRIR